MWRLIWNELKYKSVQILSLYLFLLIFLICMQVMNSYDSDSAELLMLILFMLLLLNQIASWILIKVDYQEKRLRYEALLPISIVGLSLARLMMIIVLTGMIFIIIAAFILISNIPYPVSKVQILFTIHGVSYSLVFFWRLTHEVQYLSARTRKIGFLFLILLPMLTLLGLLVSQKLLTVMKLTITPWAGVLFNLTALILFILSHLSFIRRKSFVSTFKTFPTIFDYIANMKRSD